MTKEKFPDVLAIFTFRDQVNSRTISQVDSLRECTLNGLKDVTILIEKKRRYVTTALFCRPIIQTRIQTFVVAWNGQVVT